MQCIDHRSALHKPMQCFASGIAPLCLFEATFRLLHFVLQNCFYHRLHVLAYLDEVLVEDALTLVTALECVELGQRDVACLFFLDGFHVKIGLAEFLIVFQTDNIRKEIPIT